MSYSLNWRNPSLPFAQKQTPITVPAGSLVSNAASLRFTGKGAANYGKVAQENLMRLLENFAGPTAPDYPTVGQTWYDTSENVLKVCVATAPSALTWKALHSTQIDPTVPSDPVVGDTWFQKTGTMSGIGYTYTGAGRYPQKTFNSADYFPSTSTTMTALLNKDSFTNTQYSECYICGLVSGSAADVNGTIVLNGTSTTMIRGVLNSEMPVTNGFIVWDAHTQLMPTRHFLSVRQLNTGDFQYDDNTGWVNLDLDSLAYPVYAVGTLTVLEQDDQTAPGVSAATIWSEAIPLSEMTQVPETHSEGAIGGWVQTFPPIDVGAGRIEYDYVLDVLSSLIGDTVAFGGNGALGRSITYLTPFNTLDASLRAAWSNASPVDQNVSYSADALSALKVEPNSQDWDKLLAASKYALNRLELPATVLADVSTLPFVYDGRIAAPELLSLSNSSVQYPDKIRLTNTRPGTASMMRMYQETINALRAGTINKTLLKGMQGTSGVNTSFSSNVGTHSHVTYTANAAGSSFSTTVSNGVQFRFDTSDVNLQRFFAAGQAIEVQMLFTPSGTPTAADVNLKSLADTYGRFRVTNDATFVMNSTSTPGLTLSPSVGFASLGTSFSVLATATYAGASLVLRGRLVKPVNSPVKPTVLELMLDIVAGGATTGQIALNWNRITDDEVYNGSTRVFPDALTYAGTDKLGNTSGLSLFN